MWTGREGVGAAAAAEGEKRFRKEL